MATGITKPSRFPDNPTRNQVEYSLGRLTCQAPAGAQLSICADPHAWSRFGQSYLPVTFLSHTRGKATLMYELGCWFCCGATHPVRRGGILLTSYPAKDYDAACWLRHRDPGSSALETSRI